MQIGTGLQNKVLEALSMELPCIVSSLAASAIPNSPLIVANEPEEFINAIDRLLSLPKEATLLGEKGRKFVEEHYSWETSTNCIYDLIRQH
jgi:glycosyltransferase involved in cell wall biosynthesis